MCKQVKEQQTLRSMALPMSPPQPTFLTRSMPNSISLSKCAQRCRDRRGGEAPRESRGEMGTGLTGDLLDVEHLQLVVGQDLNLHVLVVRDLMLHGETALVGNVVQRTINERIAPNSARSSKPAGDNCRSTAKGNQAGGETAG